MTTWFSSPWRWGGATYVGFVTVFAGFALASDRSGPVEALLILTLPAGYFMNLLIYLAGGIVDEALGYGLNGSPASLSIGVVGFAFAAAVNVFLLWMAVLGLSEWSRRRKIRAGG